MGLKPLYIFDLDGTLALMDHRRHFILMPRISKKILKCESMEILPQMMS